MDEVYQIYAVPEKKERKNESDFGIRCLGQSYSMQRRGKSNFWARKIAARNAARGEADNARTDARVRGTNEDGGIGLLKNRRGADY